MFGRRPIFENLPVKHRSQERHLMGLVALLLAVLMALPAAAKGAPDSFADLAERLAPAVVNISTSQTVSRPEGEVPMPQFPPGSPLEDFFKDFLDRQRQGNGAPRKVQSLGSGFVIDATGIVVTNNHVIDGADEIEVNFTDGTTLPAKILGTDEKTDIAVLKVEPEEPLTFVEFGDSDVLRVGEWVLAIGNPFGLGGSVSAGIVSARNRDINAGPYDDFIQTDAAINRGNSGGPLFDMEGRVIGINSAIISPSGGSIGIGFAIPSALAANVVDQLRQFGETRRGWLGVRIQTVTEEIAETLGLDEARGALVAGVSEDGPAAGGGLKQGDVILTFDGKPVPEMRQLPRIVAETAIGRAVDVEVWRKGAMETLQVTIGKLEEAKVAALASGEVEKSTDEAVEGGLEVPSIGLTLSAIDDKIRDKFEIGEDVQGVAIEVVNPDSAAAEKGILPGDVIVEVAQEEVRSPSDVKKIVADIEKSDRKSVLLLLNRGGDLRFVPVRLSKS